VKTQIVANASLGKGGGNLAGASADLVLRIKDAVLGGVVNGLTDTMLVAAVACFLGAALALFLREPAEETESAPGTQPQEELIAEPVVI
jgi:hypothetical protein